MSNKIVIAGNTGFTGKYLTQKFIHAGFTVVGISRQSPNIPWNDQTAIIEALEDADMLLNLAGKSVDCRYNEKNKKEIFDSRIDTTQALGEAILKCKSPPKLWINSSTATIYRHAEDRPMTESTGEIGEGFSVNVAINWEKTFFNFTLPRTRQIALRMAIVLGKNGGVMSPLTRLVRSGLGAKQGNGRQMFSWIHIEDLFRILQFLRKKENLSGIFNTSAPGPVKNKVLMQTLRKKLHIAFGLPLPKWLLELGAVLIKTETELILKSRWVIPEKLTQEGYVFKYPNLSAALSNLTNSAE
jgi:uncharacterized protein (TIGR01777 family)